MSALHAFGYVLLRALRGMAQTPAVQLIAIATMAVCMMLLGTITLAFENAHGIARSWGVDVPITVYFLEDADPDDIDALVESVAAMPEVEAATRVTPEQAMRRLHEGLGSEAGLLDGISADVLPVSLEIDLRGDVDETHSGELATRLQASEIVEEVVLTGAWAGRANEMLDTVRTLALGAGVLVGFACLAIVWSTIRLAVYARRAEVEILRLCGGTRRFVYGPFCIEGMLQGACGAAVALTLLSLGFDAIHPFVERGLSLMFAAGALQFFSPGQIVLGVVIGAFIGALGSRAAVGRYIEV